jgi:type III restriction enzyme
LVGLTATPHKKTPPEQLIYRYPLAAAIADRLVKTPVLVGRRDDRGGETLTKLQDGIRLLEAKRAAMETWSAASGKPTVNPVLLVIAQTIEGAEEVSALVKADEFFGGRYAEAVLTVHSKAPDEALAALDSVEDPESPVRIIVSVGMLKEGWDVKNVYAICSLRPLLSDVLTEQTLGRGLRLPWGEYTGVPLLDTLEVLAHDRYEALLKKTSVINEEFVDYRTRLVVRTSPDGTETAHVETTRAGVEIGAVDAGVGIASLEERESEAEAERLVEELRPRDDLPALQIPRLKMTKVDLKFSLADITDLNAFESLGRRIATDPDDDLRRMELGARIVTGADGLRRTELVTTTGERIESAARTIPLEEARAHLVDTLLGSQIVVAREAEARAAERIVDAFLAGLGDDAERALSAYLDRAAASLVRAVTTEHRRFVGKPQYEQVIERIDFVPVRVARAHATKDRTGTFSRSMGYEGWSKSMYLQVWFDSSTERTLAQTLDDSDEIRFWVRLNTGDLPILWQSDGREYNPDFVAVEVDAVHWLVESKMDKEMETADVAGKENAALRWASHVSSKTPTEWRYLLVSESDVSDARGSWAALKKLGRS